MLEQSPASASGYLTLADYYAEQRRHRLAPSPTMNTRWSWRPGRADVHDRIALAYYKQGARAQAIAEWKQVFSVLQQQANSARMPESFWTDFARTCNHLSSNRTFNDLKPDVDALLRTYLRHNGNYRSNALLHSAYIAATSQSDPPACDHLAARPGCSRSGSRALCWPTWWMRPGFRWHSVLRSISASWKQSRMPY